ncbi:MAG: ATP-dependent Clp protease proteolytic subunit [Chitinispirillales bacterium]|jgi:ATP-dependent Clp protease protease subunit|nr:ATP-dependent Clp protease proteolytic subunit [Chitinispirillales bacterium]
MFFCNEDEDDEKKEKEDKTGGVQNKIAEKFLEDRAIFLWEDVNDKTAKAVVQQILYFDSLNNNDITFYINSPGGSISAGLAIYDAMQFAKSDVRTICMGQAASFGAVLLAAGTQGKRDIWENARVMIHQPLIMGNMVGVASDIEIQAEEMLRIKGILNAILSKHTRQKVEKIEKDTDRDNFLSAQETIEYGLADNVIKVVK